LALNIYHEARVDLVKAPNDAWGVGFVTLKRLKMPDYPKTICEVVFQKTQLRHAVRVLVGKNHMTIHAVPQFTWTLFSMDALIPREAWAWTAVQKIAFTLYTHPKMRDITHGATNFYAPLFVDPNCKWPKSPNVRITAEFGGHLFIKMVSDTEIISNKH
jgi:spore germination cell wall hydrolase CwlJ-like protein